MGSLLLAWLPLLGMGANDLWYSVPLVATISLVYSATRHESMGPILWGSLRFAGWIAVFLAAAFGVLYVLAERL